MPVPILALPVSIVPAVGIFAAVITAAIAAALFYSIVFPRQPFQGPLPALTNAEDVLVVRLESHVTAIASTAHNIEHYSELEAAAVYIETTLRGFGFNPLAHVYQVRGRAVRNIEIVFEPADTSPNPPCIVIGAHYDSADDAPGANDNGSAVAAALELARALIAFKPASHRLRLAFWVNEEAPYGMTPDMGSWQHAKALKEAGETIEGMIALETLGYFSDEPGTQQFPAPFNYVYSNVGNFVAFVGLPGSRAFVRKTLAMFRSQTQFPSIGGVAPGFIEGIDLSDHWAFHQFGFPSMMITDTAPFRNPYYHQRDDLPENVDYESLARITAGLERMMRQLVTEAIPTKS
jgi:Peptidase family M28